jgi:hypothetical protein
VSWLPGWHKTRDLSPKICDTLTPGNSRVALPILQGGFVSPMRVALYARVSAHDQHTLAMPMDAMRELATRRRWTVADAVAEVASGATDYRPKRQVLLKAATQRQRDVILV